MEIRRGARALGMAALGVTLLSAGLVAQNNNRKLTDAQRREVQAVMKIVDGAAKGQPAPNDLSLTWVGQDVLKAQGNKQYVPFTVALDPSKATAKELTIYWRVVPKESPDQTAKPDEDRGRDRDRDRDRGPQYAYEDLNTATVSGSGPARISRSYTVDPGAYDVHVVVKEPTSNQRNAPAPKVSYITQSVEIPDFWNGELNTSSVIIAERIDPLPAPLTPEQQAERPYALGTMEIVPAPDTTFDKQAELATFLLIYNAQTDAANKPDVTVEYNFYTKQGSEEKFFNKTNPQSLNGQTLPPEFDFAAGHQLQSGQAVPLASFPAGDYRLEIKVTDKLANKTITRDVNFTVSGS